MLVGPKNGRMDEQKDRFAISVSHVAFINECVHMIKTSNCITVCNFCKFIKISILEGCGWILHNSQKLCLGIGMLQQPLYVRFHELDFTAV